MNTEMWPGSSGRGIAIISIMAIGISFTCDLGGTGTVKLGGRAPGTLLAPSYEGRCIYGLGTAVTSGPRSQYLES